MRQAFPFLIFLILLLVDVPGRGQPPANDSLSFEFLKGKLSIPVDRFTSLVTYEEWLKQCKTGCINGGCGGGTKSLTIQSDSPMIVKNMVAGKVLAVFEVDGFSAAIIRHGRHFFIYSNLDNTFIKKDEVVTLGQPIGNILTKSFGGSYELELMLSAMNGDKYEYIDPYPWFVHSRYF